jgi:hypothetical protein
MENFANPAVWALVGLIAWPLSLVLGTLLTRGRLRELNDFIEEIEHDPRTNEADRVWMCQLLDEATDWRPLALTVILAPILPILAVFAGLDMMNDDPDPKRQYDKTKKSIDRLDALLAAESGYINPSNGFFWNDDRRHEMRDETLPINFLKNPLLLLWIGIWAIPSVVILLATGAIKPTAHFFRDQVTPLVRRWVSAVSLLSGRPVYR